MLCVRVTVELLCVCVFCYWMYVCHRVPHCIAHWSAVSILRCGFVPKCEIATPTEFGKWQQQTAIATAHISTCVYASHFWMTMITHWLTEHYGWWWWWWWLAYICVRTHIETVYLRWVDSRIVCNVSGIGEWCCCCCRSLHATVQTFLRYYFSHRVLLAFAVVFFFLYFISHFFSLSVSFDSCIFRKFIYTEIYVQFNWFDLRCTCSFRSIEFRPNEFINWHFD